MAPRGDGKHALARIRKGWRSGLLIDWRNTDPAQPFHGTEPAISDAAAWFSPRIRDSRAPI